MKTTEWAGTLGERRRPSTWAGDGSRVYEEHEQASMDEAADWLDRVHVPGKDPEPQWTAELMDRYGDVWRKTTEGARGKSHGTACWSPEGCPELGLKWSSPAMFTAGPFIGPRLRTSAEISAQKARAANVRWGKESGVAA